MSPITLLRRSLAVPIFVAAPAAADLLPAPSQGIDTVRVALHRSLGPALLTTQAAQAAQPVPPTGAAPGQPLVVEDVELFGEVFDRDLSTGLITVTGNPRAVSGPMEVRGTRITVDPRTRQATAEGDVLLIQEGQLIYASRATYNFRDKTGQAENAHGQFQQLLIAAEEMTMETGPVYLVRRARVTTCDRDDPHYELYARRARIIPQKRFIGNDVGFDLLGKRMFTLPKYSRSLEPASEETVSPYPSVGYSGREGPYIRKEMILRHSDPYWLDAEAQINTRRPPFGGLRFSTTGSLQTVAALYYRDYAENQRARHLQVSRLPEVGLIWGRQGLPRPGKFLPHQISSVSARPSEGSPTRWQFQAQASAGFFLQHHGDRQRRGDGADKSGGRLTLQGQAVLPQVSLGPARLDGLRFMLRQHLYGTGDSYAVFGAGVGKHYRFGPWTVGISRFSQMTNGSTPFLFDDVELRQEWRPTAEYRTRRWHLAYTGRINASTGRLYNHLFTISTLFHCIEPEITYQTRHHRIEIQFRIPGLFSRGSTPVLSPRTVDTPEDLARPLVGPTQFPPPPTLPAPDGGR
jgi:hypothetical protein